MSAWIVSKSHIDKLVKFAISVNATYRGEETWHGVVPENADVVGNLLWEWNLQSVIHRYPGLGPSERPGPLSRNIDLAIDQYTYHAGCRSATPVEILKMIRCLRYQSCEPSNWKDSPACELANSIESHAIDQLPGYQEAPLGDADYQLSPNEQAEDSVLAKLFGETS